MVLWGQLLIVTANFVEIPIAANPEKGEAEGEQKRENRKDFTDEAEHFLFRTTETAVAHQCTQHGHPSTASHATLSDRSFGIAFKHVFRKAETTAQCVLNVFGQKLVDRVGLVAGEDGE